MLSPMIRHGSEIRTPNLRLQQRRVVAQKRKGRAKIPASTFRLKRFRQLVREDRLQLFHDLFFRMSLGDRQFLDEQGSRSVEHLALAERQFLVALKHEQIAQHLCDFQRRTRLDFFRVLAVAAIPRLRIDLYLALAQDTVDFFHHIFADNAAQSDRLDVFRRYHDGHLLGAEDSEHVKTSLRPGNNPHLDVLDDGYPMGGVNHLFTLLERQIHCDIGTRKQAVGFRTWVDDRTLHGFTTDPISLECESHYATKLLNL